MEKKCFEVIVKCGHVGKNNYILNAMPVRARNKKEAAERARNFPRVKHDHKDAIKSVREIIYEEYQDLLKIYRNDNFNFVHCKQDQRFFCGEDFYNRIIREEGVDEVKEKTKREKVNYKLAYYKMVNKELNKEVSIYNY